jgi:hypothetical protein
LGRAQIVVRVNLGRAILPACLLLTRDVAERLRGRPGRQHRDEGHDHDQNLNGEAADKGEIHEWLLIFSADAPLLRSTDFT